MTQSQVEMGRSLQNGQLYKFNYVEFRHHLAAAKRLWLFSGSLHCFPCSGSTSLKA